MHRRDPVIWLVIVLVLSTVIFGVIATSNTQAPTEGERNSRPPMPSRASQSLAILRDCLTSAGATVPAERDDLRDYALDLILNRVNTPAGAGNGLATVAEHQPTLTFDSSKRPPRLPYVVYVGQPVGKELDGLVAMKDRREETFVVQAIQPTKPVIRRLRRCLDEFGT